VRHIFRLLTCVSIVWLSATPPVTAEPIVITAGVVTVSGSHESAAVTLRGTDGVRAFTFDGFTEAEGFRLWDCRPCTTQIRPDVLSETGGNVTYGGEQYRVGSLDDSDGVFRFSASGPPILLPLPKPGETRSFSGPFALSTRVIPPFNSGGVANLVTGSGFVTVTVSEDLGLPGTWYFRSAEYRFTEPPGGQAPVPEPTSFLLLASGLSGLVLKRRSWRK
jgi:hypothetical protein